MTKPTYPNLDELQADIDYLVSLGLVEVTYNKDGEPLYKITESGMEIFIKESGKLN